MLNTVSISLTSKCNINCTYCYESENQTGEMPKSLLNDILQQLSDYGVHNIILSGGEPLLYKHIIFAIEKVITYNLKPIICTSGDGFNENLGRIIWDLGVSEIEFSVDSINPDINKITRPNQNLEKLIDSIKIANKIGFTVKAGITACSTNSNFIYKFLEFSVEHDIKKIRISPLVVSKASINNHIKFDRNERIDLFTKINHLNKSQSYKTEIELDDMVFLANSVDGLVYNVLREYSTKENILLGCSAGISICAIDYLGNIYPCPMLKLSCGNLYKSSFSNIWENSDIIRILKERSMLKGECGKCNNKSICGGCRANAYNIYNDYLMSDPFCTNIKEIIR